MSISKTRWNITADRITLYPFGQLFILGGALGLIFIGLITALHLLPGNQLPEYNTLLVLALLVSAGFILHGFTYIEFDRNTLRMRKVLFGFIPVLNVPFEKLYGIKLIQRVGAGAGIVYRLVYNADKYGKGITVSSGYGQKDKRAEDFSQTVIPAVHQFLDAAAPAAAPQPTVITEYEYFTWADDVFTVKVKKATNVIVGTCAIALGVYILYAGSDMGAIRQWGIGGACVVVGAIILGTLFTPINFNTRTRLIEKKAPSWAGGTQIPFDNIVDVHLVRHHRNGIYTHTAVSLKYQRAGSGKTGNLPIATLRDSRKIERLLAEINSIVKK
ncbi:hypothetical protein DCC81_20395 [Chitinophaga parva]|uniref:Uncharacterized protein n=1 Tax=Chitinophaga parva TaxID=2169414 RepID=A0A2T7BCP7_9BACT|nr:hypothetical protein [Chitinophaga parva]PUZ22790.1 hypothetical protein DCC81_20395 [Chitinophaga parva]